MTIVILSSYFLKFLKITRTAQAIKARFYDGTNPGRVPRTLSSHPDLIFRTRRARVRHGSAINFNHFLPRFSPFCRTLLSESKSVKYFYFQLSIERREDGEGRNRTADAGIFSPSLYRLSYLATMKNQRESLKRIPVYFSPRFLSISISRRSRETQIFRVPPKI